MGLSALPLFGDRKPLTVIGRAHRDDFAARFSPDGRWIAYAVDDSGRSEVFVTDFPEGTQRWQVSTDGGTQPRWRRDGRELFYAAPDGKIMSVEIGSGRTFQAGAPKVLFETLSPWMAGFDFYDVAPDGQRFLMNLPPSQSTPPLSLIVNWTAALKK
jgi:Tol biopolymer transport system component